MMVSHGAGSEVCVLSLTLPGMSVLMLALACGVCVGGTFDALLCKSTLHASPSEHDAFERETASLFSLLKHFPP